jgi:hypothetical protein
MSEQNPYQFPSASAATVEPLTPAIVAQPRAVSAGRGWEWIADGFSLFKKQPGTWILIIIVFSVCLIALAMLPLLGALANLVLMQVFMGGLMLGCRALDTDQPFELGHLFAGFKQSTGDLMVLGVLVLVGWVIAMIPVVIIMGGGAVMTMMMGGSPAVHLGAVGASLMVGVLSMLAIALLLYMALWFAPALIVFNGLKPVDAMKASFVACLKNFIPFLVYGVIITVLTMIAAIPFMLGFLVLGPVWIASVYTGYRDIFAAP